jgi:hypothetical protein
MKKVHWLLAAVRGGSCMPLYALATAVRRPGGAATGRR